MTLAMALTGGDFAIIGGLLGAFVGVPIMITLFSIKGVAKRVDTVEDGAHKRINGVEEQIREVEKRKVDKVDWLRETVSNRQKLDRMGETVASVNQRLQDAFGVGAAMNKLAEKLGALLEKRSDG